jgi:hypothetical protein
MLTLLIQGLSNWLKATQGDRWESYLSGSSDVAQVEQRIRELEEARPGL